ncbi:MAG: ABC transporter ATP-binding protein [Bacteroidales bacterium]|nr:ABC transporter ATP-binding protein [Bacteroidales bacterium]
MEKQSNLPPSPDRRGAGSEAAIIEIKDLKRDFQVGDETVHALRGITFSIQQGEFVSIMGTSGSGKSTLLNILGCLDTPTAGDYIIDGVNAATLSRNELADIRNHKIGFVFQSYNLLPRTSVLENVELPLMYNKEYTARQRRDRALEAIRRVGLEQRLQHTSAQLSGGQQQRVAIARALVSDPVILLADEATGNLDTRTSYEIMALFQELHASGTTIAFVTHEPDIAAFTTRTIKLRDGHITEDIPVQTQNAQAALDALPKNEDY